MTLMDQALVHNSATHEPTENNERLEFLGDAVLEIVVSEWLYKRYPKARPGGLTALRTSYVCTDNLAACARRLKLADRLVVGRSIRGEGGLERPKILADAVEAQIGAIYLTEGLAAARQWVLVHILLWPTVLNYR